MSFNFWRFFIIFSRFAWFSTRFSLFFIKIFNFFRLDSSVAHFHSALRGQMILHRRRQILFHFDEPFFFFLKHFGQKIKFCSLRSQNYDYDLFAKNYVSKKKLCAQNYESHLSSYAFLTSWVRALSWSSALWTSALIRKQFKKVNTIMQN